MPLEFCCGAECGVTSGGEVPTPDTRHWNQTATIPPSVETTVVRSGLRAWRVQPDGVDASGLVRSITALPSNLTLRVSFYFLALPDADTDLVRFDTVSGATWGALWFRRTPQTIAARMGPGLNYSASAQVVTPSKWYTFYLSFRAAQQLSVMAQDDAVGAVIDLGTAFFATTSSPVTQLRIGCGFSAVATADVIMDDIAYSHATLDHPLADGQVLSLIPTRDGTHAFTDGEFKRANVTDLLAATDTAWQEVAGRPLSLGVPTAFLSQNTINATGYVELGFEPAPVVTAPRGIEVVSTHSGDGNLNANASSMKLNDGGTLAAIYTDRNFSFAGLETHSKHFATAPSGGAWTVDKLDALLVRLGYATDVFDPCWWAGLMLEAEFPREADPEPTPVFGVAWVR